MSKKKSNASDFSGATRFARDIRMHLTERAMESTEKIK